MGLSPALVGGVKATVASPLPAVAVPMTGAPGPATTADGDVCVPVTPLPLPSRPFVSSPQHQSESSAPRAQACVWVWLVPIAFHVSGPGAVSTGDGDSWVPVTAPLPSFPDESEPQHHAALSAPMAHVKVPPALIAFHVSGPGAVSTGDGDTWSAVIPVPLPSCPNASSPQHQAVSSVPMAQV